MSKIDLPHLDEAKEGNLAAARMVWTHLADRLDALDADEREMLRAALRNLGAGITAAKAFMPADKRPRGGIKGRPRSAGATYFHLYQLYLERIHAGEDEASAKRAVAARKGCTVRQVQRAVAVVEESYNIE